MISGGYSGFSRKMYSLWHSGQLRTILPSPWHFTSILMPHESHRLRISIPMNRVVPFLPEPEQEDNSSTSALSSSRGCASTVQDKSRLLISLFPLWFLLLLRNVPAFNFKGSRIGANGPANSNAAIPAPQFPPGGGDVCSGWVPHECYGR